MAGVTMPDMRPWSQRSLIIPPDSPAAWLRLAVWEIWMGTLVATTGGLGTLLVVSSPNRVIAVADLNDCYAPPPVALPCEHLVYRGGALDAAFTALCGVMLIGVAAWFLWELWGAAAPRPITDDFLRLLNRSFGRNWRNPLKWPWAHLCWAYGFTLLGATLAVAAGVSIWTVLAESGPARTPTPHVGTSQSFTLAH